MSKEMQIEVISYERERLDYFTNLMKKAQKRYKRLFEKHKNCGYMSPEYLLLCDAGRKAHFHGDVVEMLEKGNQKQSEGKWIDVEDTFLYRYKCSLCGEIKLGKMTNFCPNCGAKMKGGAE